MKGNIGEAHGMEDLKLDQSTTASEYIGIGFYIWVVDRLEGFRAVRGCGAGGNDVISVSSHLTSSFDDWIQHTN